MLTIPQVNGVRSEVFGELEESLAHMATDMDEAAAGLFDNGTKALPESWKDTTGALAAGEIGRLAYSYSIVGVKFRAACSVLSGLDLSFTGAKSKIAAWLAECARRGFRVSDTGTVMLGTDAEASGSLTDQLDRASMITTQLTAALNEATLADQQAAQALTSIGLTELDADGKDDIDVDDLKLHRDNTLPEGVDTGLEIIRQTMPRTTHRPPSRLGGKGCPGPSGRCI